MAKVHVSVPVSFSGAVDIYVPESVPEERRQVLARKIAVARIFATMDNPDCATSEDNACGEYETQFGLNELEAETDWDNCENGGVSGEWSDLPSDE